MHCPSGQLHWPPQHSSFGRLTVPNPNGCAPTIGAYTVVSIGSNNILRCTGGGGSAAARAKKRSRKLTLVPGPSPRRSGSALPMLGSTHVPQPSAQSVRARTLSTSSSSSSSASSSTGARCSTHPGHAHLTPHVQPDPASDASSLIGGIEANSGIGDAGADGEEVKYSSGARSGPGAAGGAVCLGRLLADRRVVGLPDRVRVPERYERGLCAGEKDGVAVGEGGLQQLIAAAARARVSSPSDGSACCGLDPGDAGPAISLHLHFQRLLQSQGLRSESTVNEFRIQPVSREIRRDAHLAAESQKVALAKLLVRL